MAWWGKRSKHTSITGISAQPAFIQSENVSLLGLSDMNDRSGTNFAARGKLRLDLLIAALALLNWLIDAYLFANFSAAGTAAGHTADVKLLVLAPSLLTACLFLLRLGVPRLSSRLFFRIGIYAHVALGVWTTLQLTCENAPQLGFLQFAQAIIFSIGILHIAEMLTLAAAVTLAFFTSASSSNEGFAFAEFAIPALALVGGVLSESARRMRRALIESRLQVRQQAALLESRVIERTAALASTNAAIQRFVPREFLHALGHDDVTTTKLGDATAKSITVLFADIRNFTSSSEGMTPEETFAFLNGCLSKLGPHVRAQSGFVDKYIGDAIMALFPRDPSDAVRAAIAMQEEVRRSNDAFVGREALSIGVGIHVGNVMMGTIGEAERFEATVISDAVNLTARLESLTKQLGCSVLISEDVFATLDEELRRFTRRLGTFVVKGKAQPVALYEVFASDSDSLRDAKKATRDRFDAMLTAFAGDRIDEAIAIASELRDACPEDGPANWWFMRLVKESASTGDDAVPSSRGIVRLDEK